MTRRQATSAAFRLSAWLDRLQEQQRRRCSAQWFAAIETHFRTLLPEHIHDCFDIVSLQAVRTEFTDSHDRETRRPPRG